MASTVAIVGVGNMGGGMAGRLLELGWPVRVHDTDRGKVHALQSRGAVACSDAAQAGTGASALVVCVVDAEQTHDVLFGLRGAAAALSAGTPVLLCPTIAPDDVERLAAALADRGLLPVDAPMSADRRGPAMGP